MRSVGIGNDQARDLTQHEIRALATTHNLADAHTHQRQSARQRRIVAELPRLWYEAEEELQAHVEQRFLQAFFTLHRQDTALAGGRSLLCYAASVSTLVAAMYLRQRDMRVALVEPCFDNLHDILQNMQVERIALPEDALADPGAIRTELARYAAGADALFLVDPNNPTGTSLLRAGRQGFAAVARYCRDNHLLLLLDRCFAAFALHDERVDWFDVYHLLEESGVSYLVVEDTGKTWPVQDAKCSIISTSTDIWDDVYDLHTSVLLNVSPFVLNLLTRYIEDSIADDLHSVRAVLAVNRDTVRDALDGSILQYQPPATDISVAWLRITDPQVTATQLHRTLAAEDVYVLPGTHFFWRHRHRGERFVRIALARDPAMFAAAVRRLRQVMDRHAW